MATSQDEFQGNNGSQCVGIRDMLSESVQCPIDGDSQPVSSSSSHESMNDDINMTIPKKEQKKKQNCSRQKKLAKNSRSHENRKANSKTDCPFCGVTLMYYELVDHVKIHALDVFTFKRSRKKPQHQEPQPLHKKDYGMVLKQRCERPQAHYLSPKPDFLCPFCKRRIFWWNDEGREDAKEHLKSCREISFKTSLEILEEVPSGSSPLDESADINDFIISDDYLGSDTMRITGSDENEILDIENDDTVLYGPNQYSDQDVVPQNFENPEISLLATVSTNSSNDDGADRVGGEEDDDGSEEDQELQDDFSCIDSLQRKPRESEHIRGALCPVCMDEFRTPLTAIGCWHVLCESCWLTALTVKKICPVCKTIVSSDALRRVYL